MKLKSSVNASGVQQVIIDVLKDCEKCYREVYRPDYEMTVTSLNDSRHKKGSLHYKGLAADLRTRDIPQDLCLEVTECIKQKLSNDFDVIFEKDHIHVEYDPE